MPPAPPIPAPRRPLPGRLLAGMRIRKKLILLHTFFSLVLAGILLVAVWPAVTRVVQQAEFHEARFALSVAVERITEERAAATAISAPFDSAEALARIHKSLPQGVTITRAPLESYGLIPDVPPGDATGRTAWLNDGTLAPFIADHADRVGYVATARLDDARAGVRRLLWMMTFALLGIYGLIAVALEIFVLPEHVYGPIRRLLDADRAVRANDRERELIPATAMPADELGEIMASRNGTIIALRNHERALAEALHRLEATASDLARKNHLLETAQRNLADADRLASLGMMSAGLAHELNTPLAVIKGLVEKIGSSERRSLEPAEAALLLRVVQRLERLSESLLDFARVRPPRAQVTHLRALADEAWTLVALDREARGGGMEFRNAIPEQLIAWCDPDRMVQVFVNLLRNAADATRPGSGGGGVGTPIIEVAARRSTSDQGDWFSITIADNGPGIDPAVINRLFEPFASTRLDSRGTGLGLAVSEGIVKEHGGLLLARNRECGGAEFEVLLPAREPAPGAAPAVTVVASATGATT